MRDWATVAVVGTGSEAGSEAEAESRPKERRAGMKVVVDWDLCEANALCMDACPEVFRVEEDDTLTILLDDIPEDLRAKVENAARLCPRQAITVEG
jgi:ferredoxin